MRFEYRYFGLSSASSGATQQGLSFAPDTSREPTWFSGRIADRLPFREGISALHDVVVQDGRFKPRDRSDYLAWRAQQDELDWTGIVQDRGAVLRKLEQLRTELTELQARKAHRWKGFYADRQRYFDYLYQKNKAAWFVLDPVITVHPDEVFFECFSEDESSYGRLACSYELFDQVGEFACGTTNVDYSSDLYNEFQKIRSYKDTELKVDPAGFTVETTGEDSYREVKIDLPDSWVRGFLQVSSAATLPGTTFTLHPMDVHNLLFHLTRRKETHGPRSLRVHLEPGRPVAFTLEPWNQRLECPRSVYEGTTAREVRLWGRRRLSVLQRLIPVANRFTVTVLGSGLPSFWRADLGRMSFTLGLSGWTSNDWSSAGNFDLLASRATVDSFTQQRVFDALGATWFATAEQLATQLGLQTAVVHSALGAYAQAGRVIFDAGKGVYRKRELTRTPLPIDQLRWRNERESAGAALLAAGAVRAVEAVAAGPGIRVSGEVRDRSRTEHPQFVLDADARMTQPSCSCSFHFRNKLKKGPCQHLLALRLAHAASGLAQ